MEATQVITPASAPGETRYQYRVEQLWTGWWGGFGMDSHIAGRANAAAQDGWRLVGSKVAIGLWFWFLPRPKLLLFFEKPS